MSVPRKTDHEQTWGLGGKRVDLTSLRCQSLPHRQGGDRVRAARLKRGPSKVCGAAVCEVELVLAQQLREELGGCDR